MLKGNYRWIICALLFAATTINYMDRQIIGVLKPFLASPPDGMVLKQEQYAALRPILEHPEAREGVKLTPEQAALLKPLLAYPVDGIALSENQFEVIRTLTETPPAGVALTALQIAALAPIFTEDAHCRFLTAEQFAILLPVIEKAEGLTPGQAKTLKQLLKKPKNSVFLNKEQFAVLKPFFGLTAAALGVSQGQAAELKKIANNPQGGILLTEAKYSYIVIAFQAAYALGLLIFGWCIDRFGTKLSYAGSIIFWSASSAAHSLASSVLGFSLARIALGIGEAGNFPAANKTTAEWFPKRERALVVSLFNSGTNIGAMIAPPLILLVAYTFSWRVAFLANGVLAMLWLVAWFMLYDKPSQCKALDPKENAWIHQDDGGGEQRVDPVKWRRLVKFRQTWAFAVAKFLTDPIWWFYLFWLPGWLVDSKGIDLKASVMPLVTVYFMATIGSIAIASLSSRLIGLGVSTNKARKGAMLLCAVLVIPIVFAVKANNVWLAVFLVGLAAAAHQGWSANLFSTVSDMFPKRAVASVTGFGGMMGSFGSMIFAYGIGQILDRTGEYWILFAVSASAYLIALLLFHLLARRLEMVEIE